MLPVENCFPRIAGRFGYANHIQSSGITAALI
jgi:hypothetical protein